VSQLPFYKSNFLAVLESASTKYRGRLAARGEHEPASAPKSASEVNRRTNGHFQHSVGHKNACGGRCQLASPHVLFPFFAFMIAFRNKSFLLRFCCTVIL